MATTLARPEPTRYRGVPWSRSAWRQALYLTGSIPVLLAAPALVAAGFLDPPKWEAVVAALDARAARALLGPSRAEELEHRVAHLTQTRTGAWTRPCPAWRRGCRSRSG